MGDGGRDPGGTGSSIHHHPPWLVHARAGFVPGRSADLHISVWCAFSMAHASPVNGDRSTAWSYPDRYDVPFDLIEQENCGLQEFESGHASTRIHTHPHASTRIHTHPHAHSLHAGP
jgi:hypothetical protein